MSDDSYSTQLSVAHLGQRLDQVLAKLLPDYSRSRLQQWIKEGFVRVDNEIPKIKYKIKGNEQLEVDLAKAIDSIQEAPLIAQAIPLNIVFEDDDIIIVNKPAGLVVHPGAGNPDNTMLNALLNHDAALSKIPRAGVIHRLDKETTGLLVVARNLKAHTHLVEELQNRAFEREYRAIVVGTMSGGGKINQPLGRHPTQRTKMAVVKNGRPSVTHYRILSRYPAHTELKVILETGRTHQIRVHMAHIKHPLVGDPTYGGRLRIPSGCSAALMTTLRKFGRQALHAEKLGFIHPSSGKSVCWEAPLPTDLQNLAKQLADK